MSEDNGGMKVNIEHVWAGRLKELGYKEYDGEVREIVEITGETETTEENTSVIAKSDGVVIDNLKENVTDEEVKLILAASCPDDNLDDVKINPLGSTKSKLITGVESSLLLTLVNNIN